MKVTSIAVSKKKGTRKECHKKCAIYYQAGDCIMPREGVFARVIEGGAIRRGDEIVPTGALMAEGVVAAG
ncbi:MAG: hypothetical protein AB9866_14410 [Syntrophobacteraceae bacterium]